MKSTRTGHRWAAVMVAAMGMMLAAAIAAPAQTYTTLANFGGPAGQFPYSTLVQSTDGNLYGTTVGPGLSGGVGGGTVFRLTPSGTLTTIYRFCPKSTSGMNCPNGYQPWGALVLGTDENFYGTTAGGGANNDGTLFKITPKGTLTTLHNFAGSDGLGPSAALVQGTDGNFYGTTGGGGANNAGTVFRMTPTGELTTLHSFNFSDGEGPGAPVIQGTDGSFYGTTENGGTHDGPYCAYGCGTVFRITPAGGFTSLYSFCAQTECSDGAGPYAPLIESSNGSFSGTTYYGGTIENTCAGGCGTVFKITSAGVLTTLYRCTGGCMDNTAGLVQATDGNFYSTSAGGNEQGTIFEVIPPGKFSLLYSFGTYGTTPEAGLLQATNGTFYGTTVGGSSASYFGSAFSFSVGLGPFIITLPTFRAVGQRVAILGNNLTGATSVTFNGTPATFTVVSSTEISTSVPTGATSGPVQVVTPSGTLTSNVNFRVEP